MRIFIKLLQKYIFFNIIQEELSTHPFVDINYACQLQKEIFLKFGIREAGITPTWDRASMKKKLVKT